MGWAGLASLSRNLQIRYKLWIGIAKWTAVPHPNSSRWRPTVQER